MTIAGPPRWPVWLCPPFLSVKLCIRRCTRRNRQSRLSAWTGDCSQRSIPNCPFLSEWAKCQPENTKNAGTIDLLPISKLVADSDSGSPDSYSSILVTIRVSRLALEVFASDRQTDGRTSVDHYYRSPPHCSGPANKAAEALTTKSVML